MLWGLTVCKYLVENLPLFIVLNALAYRQPDTFGKVENVHPENLEMRFNLAMGCNFLGCNFIKLYIMLKLKLFHPIIF